MPHQVGPAARAIIETLAKEANGGPLYVHNYTAIYECADVETALEHAAEDDEAIVTPRKCVKNYKDQVRLNWALREQAQIFDFDTRSRVVRNALAAAQAAMAGSPEAASRAFLQVCMEISAAKK